MQCFRKPCNDSICVGDQFCDSSPMYIYTSGNDCQQRELRKPHLEKPFKLVDISECTKASIAPLFTSPKVEQISTGFVSKPVKWKNSELTSARNWPKVFLSSAYLSASSSALWASPTLSDATAGRVRSNAPIDTLNPLFSSPNTFCTKTKYVQNVPRLTMEEPHYALTCFGTTTSSNVTPLVSDAR